MFVSVCARAQMTDVNYGFCIAGIYGRALPSATNYLFVLDIRKLAVGKIAEETLALS